MNLTDEQRDSVNKILEVFETGRIGDNYDTIALLPDGPNKRVQITFGKHQTTEYGQLPNLLSQYVRKGGKLSKEIQPYIKDFGDRTMPSFASNKVFLALLRESGKDTVMQDLQDEFFDKGFFQPAMAFAKTNGFDLPLSMAVIYDSFIHSGGVRQDIRNTFSEVPPSRKGDEKAWIRAYVDAREKWLLSNRNPIVRRTIYRMVEFREFIQEDNWTLERPLNVRGIIIR